MSIVRWIIRCINSIEYIRALFVVKRIWPFFSSFFRHGNVWRLTKELNHKSNRVIQFPASCLCHMRYMLFCVFNAHFYCHRVSIFDNNIFDSFHVDTFIVRTSTNKHTKNAFECIFGNQLLAIVWHSFCIDGWYLCNRSKILDRFKIYPPLSLSHFTFKNAKKRNTAKWCCCYVIDIYSHFYQFINGGT